MYFQYFVFISPGKGRGPSFEQTWILITQGGFVPSLVEIAPVVLEKMMKMWKIYGDKDNDGQILIRIAHFSLLLRLREGRTLFWGRIRFSQPTFWDELFKLTYLYDKCIASFSFNAVTPKKKKIFNNQVPKNYSSRLHPV